MNGGTSKATGWDCQGHEGHREVALDIGTRCHFYGFACHLKCHLLLVKHFTKRVHVSDPISNATPIFPAPAGICTNLRPGSCHSPVPWTLASFPSLDGETEAAGSSVM